MRITQDHDPSIRAEGLTGCQQPYQRSSALAWLNISGSLRDTITQFEPRLSVNYHYADCWVYVNGLSGARVDACVRDMESSPDSITLMEVMFALNLRQVAFVLVKLKYNAEAPKGQIYKVVGHVFRTAK